MNQKARKLVTKFCKSVLAYMKDEYDPRWANLYKSKELRDSMLHLSGEYYFGGNTIPFTAGQIVDLLQSKYK